MYISFFVPGTPIGKGRPRVTTHGTYTPKRTREYEKYIRKCCPNTYLLDGCLHMTLTFYFPIPKSYSKKRRKQIEEHRYYYDKKPDLDNLIKVVCDALNDVAYKDDSQVCGICCSKKYADEKHEPGVKIGIYELEGLDDAY